jgi:hypothetical protein
MAAADGLANLGMSDAIPELQRAIANEKDDAVRLQMKQSEERLQAKVREAIPAHR